MGHREWLDLSAHDAAVRNLDPSSANQVQILKGFPLFQELEAEELAQIARVMKLEQLPAQTEILTQNQDAKAVYFLTQGAVQIVINSEMVAQVETVQCFGEMSCLIPGTPASATVRTAKPSQAYRIGKQEFLDAVQKVPRLWKTLFLQMNGRFKAVNMRLSEVLVHTPQGLLKVDRKGMITNEYSMKCTEYFDLQNLSGLKFAELIRPDEPDALALWEQTYAMLFDETGMLSFNDVAELLDREIKYLRPDGAERIFVLSYYPCRNLAGAIDAIDVGVVDVTEARELERKNAQIVADQMATAKIYDNPESFLNLQKFIVQTLQDALHTLRGVRDHEIALDSVAMKDFLRKLHSLKGYSSIFALQPVQHATHHLEELIKKAQQASDMSPSALQEIAAALVPLKDSYAYTQSIFSRIGESLRKRLLGVAFSQDEFAQLKSAASATDLEAITTLIQAVEKIDAMKLVATWSDEAAKLSAQLGKEVEFTLDGDGGLIPKRIFESLDSVLIHLLRNSVDHGLESTDARTEAGKSAIGAIRVKLESDDQKLIFEISDDGRGIDFAELEEQARCNEKLDPAAIDQCVASGQPWRILFLSGFSTSEEITEISGRGVGLSVVKSLVDSVKGQLAVESQVGVGTKFRLEIPLAAPEEVAA